MTVVIMRYFSNQPRFCDTTRSSRLSTSSDRACASHFCPPRPVCLHWQRALSGHPDKVFARYVLEGLREGFRIGFTPASTLSPAPSNMQSGRLHPTVISDYISKEVEEGRMFGPFLPGLAHKPHGGGPEGPHPWPMEADHRSVSPRGCQRE